MARAVNAVEAESRQASSGESVVLPGQSPAGEYVLSVLVKRTYDIAPDGVLGRAQKDTRLFPGDVPWTDPMNSSIRFESDYIPFKPATDVVLNGKVYAPGGLATECLVSLTVGEIKKQVLVVGDRVAYLAQDRGPSFTDPLPFETIELRYERAYGGIDVFSNKSVPFPYPRNLLGRGFVVTKTSVEKIDLPNLEDPHDRLTPERLCIEEYPKWEQQPLPAGLGWFPKTWMPRARLAGILPADRQVEQQLREAYAQLVPADQRQAYLKHSLPDMDFRFFNGASPGLAVPYLQGGEEIVAENLTPEGMLAFRLPVEKPDVGLDIGFGVQTAEVAIHTVMIRMDDRQVDLVWRAAFSYPGPDWLPQMRKMEVLVV